MTKSKKHLLIIIAILSVVLICAQYFQAESMFYRSAIEDGQWWRILSGNLTHTNITHLGLNLSGLWLLIFLFYDTLIAKTFILITIFLSATVGIGLFLFNPELQKYYGFSGVLYGLFFYAAINAIIQKEFLIGSAVAILIFSKVMWDFISDGGQSSAELIGIPVATDSHLYGVLGASVIGVYYIKKKFTEDK